MSTKLRLQATLTAYRTVQVSSWPALHPTIERRAAKWSAMEEADLRRELSLLVAETERPGQEVRVFWKVGPDFTYEGCNRQLAADAGFASAGELVGLNDYDERFAWILQSAKYRRDDKEVVETRVPKLRIIERQHSAAGTTWLHTGKAPIVVGGAALGIVGMYEVIDSATASKLSRGQ